MDLQAIIQAFVVIQSPYSGSQERQHASHAIESLKQNPGCAGYMLQILQHSGQLAQQLQEDDCICFMSLKVLEDCIITCWNSSTIEAQSEV